MNDAAKLTSARRTEILWLMCTALAVVIAATISLNVALPSFARDTGATQTELTWIVGVYALVFAALLLPAGALADRLGRREVLVAGMAVFAAASAATVFIDDPTAVIFLRALAAIGAAGVMPSTLSILTSSFPASERGRAVGAWAGVAGAAGVLGLLASGGLLEAFSWRSIFVFNTVLALAVLVTVAVRVPTSRDPDATSFDGVGALLSVLGLTAIVFGIIEAPDRGWVSFAVLGSVIVGILLLIAFIRWELRTAHPLLDPRLFRSSAFASGSFAVTMQFFAIFAFQFVSLQYLQQVAGFSPLGAGAALLPIAVILQLLAPRAPGLAARFGMRAVVAGGCACIAVGLLVLAQLQVGSGFGLFLAGTVILAIGMALSGAPASQAILDALPDSHQGVASAVNDTTRELGGALGIAVLGSLLNQGYRTVVDSRLADADRLREAARPSLQAAAQTADRLGAGGQRVLDAAQNGFVHGLHIAFYGGAGAVVVGTVVFFVLAPRNSTGDEPRSLSTRPRQDRKEATT